MMPPVQCITFMNFFMVHVCKTTFMKKQCASLCKRTIYFLKCCYFKTHTWNEVRSECMEMPKAVLEDMCTCHCIIR